MCDLPHQQTVLRSILLRWPEDRNGAKWKYFSALKAHYLKHRVGCKLPPYVTLIITWTQTLTCLFLQPTHVISVNKHFNFFHASLLKYANYTLLCSCSITKKIWIGTIFTVFITNNQTASTGRVKLSVLVLKCRAAAWNICTPCDPFM